MWLVDLPLTVTSLPFGKWLEESRVPYLVVVHHLFCEKYSEKNSKTMARLNIELFLADFGKWNINIKSKKSYPPQNALNVASFETLLSSSFIEQVTDREQWGPYYATARRQKALISEGQVTPDRWTKMSSCCPYEGVTALVAGSWAGIVLRKRYLHSNT